MSKKIIFLDIDGTICNYGVVRPSAKTAIRRARENGHKVLLCTGRSLGIIDPDISRIGFDGIVASAGAYIEIGGNIIFWQKFHKNLLNFVIDYFEKYDIRYFLETNTKLYGTEENIEFQRNRFNSLQREWAKRDGKSNKQDIYNSVLIPGSRLRDREDVNKISFFDAPMKIDQIKKDWEGKLTVIPSTIEELGEDSGEISQIGITKASGIQQVIMYLGLSQEATMAVGDGSNDFEMLEYANIGIAMGNALPDLKKVADDVTDIIEEDGLFKCFEKYGLLT